MYKIGILEGDQIREYIIKGKQLNKKSREVVSSAVSSRVCLNFGEIFASRGRETNICHVW